jgi:acetyl esterase/lipase
MATWFFVVSIVGLLFTVNAIRPPRWAYALVPIFFGHWLTSELAPLLLLLHVAGIAFFVQAGALAGWQGYTALVISATIAAGLAHLTIRGLRTHHALEGALTEALGPDYRDRIHPTRVEAYAHRVRWRRMAFPFVMRRRQVRRVRNLAYGDAGRRNRLDVYVSKDAPQGAPVLLQVHGGGWTIGNKEQQGKPLMLHLAARGWVCVAINYRLSPRATFPDHIVDVKTAVAWVREHIRDYGGDPDFIAISGGSAGGHLSALAALTPNDAEYQPGFEGADTTLQAAVPIYGVYDFTGSLGGRAAEGFVRYIERVVLKRRFAEDPDDFRRASPLFRTREDAPPFFVIHGAHDRLAPVEGAREFVQRLREKSRNPVAYAELPGVQHAFDVFHSISCEHAVYAVERFLDHAWCLYASERGILEREPTGQGR